ncbi:MAG: HD domain-containing protein [Planctomycetes bacterium]|nr:HD domain-containing protein [Planctomycetota bacterium]
MPVHQGDRLPRGDGVPPRAARASGSPREGRRPGPGGRPARERPGPRQVAPRAHRRGGSREGRRGPLGADPEREGGAPASRRAAPRRDRQGAGAARGPRAAEPKLHGEREPARRARGVEPRQGPRRLPRLRHPAPGNGCHRLPGGDGTGDAWRGARALHCDGPRPPRGAPVRPARALEVPEPRRHHHPDGAPPGQQLQGQPLPARHRGRGPRPPRDGRPQGAGVPHERARRQAVAAARLPQGDPRGGQERPRVEGEERELMAARVSLHDAKRAERIFDALGAAVSELQLYGEGHPRFQRAAGLVLGMLKDLAEKHPASRYVTFFLNGKQVEFRRVPLGGLSAHGERLVKLLDAGGIGAVRIEMGIALDGVCRLVRALQRPMRTMPAPEPGPGAAAGGGFRLFAPEEARLMAIVRDRNAGLDEEAGAGDLGYSLPELRIPQEAFESILRSYCALFSSIEGGKAFDYEALKGAADQTVTLMAKSREQFVAFPRGYFDDFTFHHSVNVSMAATRVAGMVLRDRETVRRITLAALLHDVGKTCVPPEVLYKPAKLTQAEFERLKAHPVLGAEILLGVRGVDPMCVAAAFGHHMHAGRNAYPVTRRQYAADWVTELISVVDIYEALTAVRPYKKALSPERALQVMFGMFGLQSRMALVKMLYDSQGPYPVGTVVELTTGERAMVIERSPPNQALPKIRILTDPERNPLPEGEDLDLAACAARGPKGEPPRISRTIVAQRAEADVLREDPEPEPTEILGSPIHDGDALAWQEG